MSRQKKTDLFDPLFLIFLYPAIVFGIYFSLCEFSESIKAYTPFCLVCTIFVAYCGVITFLMSLAISLFFWFLIFASLTKFLDDNKLANDAIIIVLTSLSIPLGLATAFLLYQFLSIRAIKLIGNQLCQGC